jgi:hypothetical protein
VANTREISREQVATMLRGKVMLDPETKTFLITPEARAGMGRRSVVLVALLGQLALALKTGSPDVLTPKQIGAATALKGGTIRPLLRNLLADGLLVQHRSGAYSIHASSLQLIQQELDAEVAVR